MTAPRDEALRACVRVLEKMPRLLREPWRASRGEMDYLADRADGVIATARAALEAHDRRTDDGS